MCDLVGGKGLLELRDRKASCSARGKHRGHDEQEQRYPMHLATTLLQFEP
jgi:hypothetical protein